MRNATNERLISDAFVKGTSRSDRNCTQGVYFGILFQEKGITMIKTIFFTFTATMAVVTLVATLFLNTILGAFGLAATSIETLQNLKTSQQIVKRMKTRQAQKKLKVTKRFAKRPAKRIASAAVAAATVAPWEFCRNDCTGGE